MPQTNPTNTITPIDGVLGPTVGDVGIPQPPQNFWQGNQFMVPGMDPAQSHSSQTPGMQGMPMGNPYPAGVLFGSRGAGPSSWSTPEMNPQSMAQLAELYRQMGDNPYLQGLLGPGGAGINRGGL